MHNREVYQARVQGYLAMGRCPRCAGRNRLKEGETVCQECREKSTAQGRRTRERRKALGLCVRCGGERDSEGLLCTKCRDQHREYNKQYDYHGKMKALGRCVRCGKPAVPGYTLCQVHREADKAKALTPKHKAYLKELREKRKAAGKCVDCGGSMAGSTVTTLCKKCHERRMETERIKTIRRKMKREQEKERAAIDEIRKASRAKWERDAAGWRAGAQPGAAGRGHSGVLGASTGGAGTADAGQ